MGQRHQVYCALPSDSPFVKSNISKVVGIHHQWLYGHTAAHFAANFLKFVEAARSAPGCYHPMSSDMHNPDVILKAVYSCDASIGYFSNVSTLVDGECQDPLLGDNNDGITVFDLRDLTKRGGKVRYCFVSLNGHNDLPENVPLSARQYVGSYYPELVPNVRLPGRKVPTLLESGKPVPNNAEIRVRLVEATKAIVMTPERLRAIFPTLVRAPLSAPLSAPLPELGEAV